MQILTQKTLLAHWTQQVWGKGAGATRGSAQPLSFDSLNLYATATIAKPNLYAKQLEFARVQLAGMALATSATERPLSLDPLGSWCCKAAGQASVAR